MEATTCQRCGAALLSYETTIHLTGLVPDKTEILCSGCFNKQAAMLMGLKIEELDPQLIEIRGRGRKKHVFFISRMIHPTGIALKAIEIQDGEQKGYQIGVNGDLDCNQAELYEKLIKKVKKQVSRKYLEVRKIGWEKKPCIKDFEVAGRIEWDENYDGRIPLVVIDGKEYTWMELGEMLMSFEGWNFKLKIFDFSEDED